MLRRNIVEHLREVSEKARAMESMSLYNSNIDEVIDLDPAFSSALIRASLAYATVLITGGLKHQDPEDALIRIIMVAGTTYVDEL